MRKLRRSARLALAGVLSTAAVGATATAAHAYSFSIGVSAPPSASAGSSVALKVSGRNPTPGPPDEYWFPTWLSVEAVPASVSGTCPAGYDEASQLAAETVGAGGAHVTPVFIRENPNTLGDWSTSLGYTPRAAGRMLLCAYTNVGFTNTVARAQTAITVRGAAHTTAKKKRCKKAKRALAAKKCRKRR